MLCQSVSSFHSLDWLSFQRRLVATLNFVTPTPLGVNACCPVADHLGGDNEVNRSLTIEDAIVFGERGECGFGLPGHVGVALAMASFEHFNQARTSYVEIFR